MLKKTSFIPSNIASRSLAIFGLVLLSSCLGYKPGNQATEIRIVDLNGNPKPIRRIIPEGNAQMLANQQAQSANAANTDNTDNAPNNINKSASPQNYQTPNTNQITNNNIAPLPAENITNNPEKKPAEAAILYDMSNDNTPEITNATIPAPAQPNPSSSKKFKLTNYKATNTQTSHENKSGILIQIGSFSSYSNAQKALEQSSKINAGKIEEVNLSGKKSYRVFLGPISNSKKVHNILKKAKNSGYKDAFIVR